MTIDPSPHKGQSDDQDEAVIRCLYERVYSKGELGLVDDLVGADFTGHSTDSSDLLVGPSGVKSHVIGLRTAFHGFTVSIDDLQVADDTFRVAWTARGTHERRYLGVDPTYNRGRPGEDPHGNRIVVSGVSTGTILGGVIRDCRMIWDVPTLRHQLGAPVEAIASAPAVDDAESTSQVPQIVEHAPR